MSIFNRFFGKQEEIARNAAPILSTPQAADISQSSDYSDWNDIFNIGIGSAGVAVNERTAMRVSAVYSCVALISGAVVSIPLNFYKRTENDIPEKIKHDLWWLLNQEPNPCYSAGVLWEFLLSSILLHGDAFAKIIRPSRYSPKIAGFEGIHPLAVSVQKKDGRLIYTIYRLDGKTEVVDQDDMLHVPNLGFDGLRGASTLKNALLQSAGIAIAADQYSGEFFQNGAMPDFAIKTKGKLTPEQAESIKNNIASRHSGMGNRHKPMVLQGDLEIEKLSINAEDAQLLATRQFQVEDIARIFGVPPFMIGHNEKTTSWGAGIEQLGIGFVKYTLNKYLVKFQQEINRKCFRATAIFCEFNTAGLERGDLKSRYEAHRISLGRAGEPAWKTVNEVRRLENEAPIEGGDALNTGIIAKGASDAANTQTSSGQ